MKFSLMIPTRKRPQQLRRLLESIINTTNEINEIEIHFGIDNDDVITKNLIKEFETIYSSYKFYPHYRGRGNSLVNHYINWLVTFCKGDYIITLNDDSIFESKDWDILVYNRLEDFLKDKKDRLVCGVCDDGFNDQNRANLQYPITGFPLLSKEAVKTLGFFLDPMFMDCTADDDICRLFATIGRSVNLIDIFKVIHLPYWDIGFEKKSELDKNYQTLQDSHYDFKMPHPYKPNTVPELIHYLDKRILILLNRILEYHNGS